MTLIWDVNGNVETAKTFSFHTIAQPHSSDEIRRYTDAPYW